MRVNETFCSIQGEGARAGTLNVFIRLSGCDLACGFCDTEFESGKELTPKELLKEIQQYNCKNIVWTGGEPALQLTYEIIDFFGMNGYYQAIETNGNNKIPENINYIALSPKVAEHVLDKNFPYNPGGYSCDELRYVRHKGQLALPETKLYARHYFISPMFNGNEINIENLNHCIKLLEGQNKWQISIQTHKLLKVL